MEPHAQAQPRPKELDLNRRVSKNTPSSQAKRVASSHKETPSPSECCQRGKACILIYSRAMEGVGLAGEGSSDPS